MQSKGHLSGEFHMKAQVSIWQTIVYLYLNFYPPIASVSYHIEWYRYSIFYYCIKFHWITVFNLKFKPNFTVLQQVALKPLAALSTS